VATSRASGPLWWNGQRRYSAYAAHGQQPIGSFIKSLRLMSLWRWSSCETLLGWWRHYYHYQRRWRRDGERNGTRVESTCAVRAPSRPAARWMRVVSRTSTRLIDGRTMVNRHASLDVSAPEALDMGDDGQNTSMDFRCTLGQPPHRDSDLASLESPRLPGGRPRTRGSWPYTAIRGAGYCGA
jgi:hypothetical protein